MLEYDWLFTALIYGDWLFEAQTVRLDLSDYEHL